jgi:hypothetical protein
VDVPGGPTKAFVHRFFKELINQSRLKVADEIYTADYANYLP